MSESSCCGATIIYTDICGKCKEHCNVIEVYCTQCEWDGLEEELINGGDGEDERCPNCGNKGINDV